MTLDGGQTARSHRLVFFFSARLIILNCRLSHTSYSCGCCRLDTQNPTEYKVPMRTSYLSSLLSSSWLFAAGGLV